MQFQSIYEYFTDSCLAIEQQIISGLFCTYNSLAKSPHRADFSHVFWRVLKVASRTASCPGWTIPGSLIQILQRIGVKHFYHRIFYRIINSEEWRMRANVASSLPCIYNVINVSFKIHEINQRMAREQSCATILLLFLPTDQFALLISIRHSIWKIVNIKHRWNVVTLYLGFNSIFCCWREVRIILASS